LLRAFPAKVAGGDVGVKVAALVSADKGCANCGHSNVAAAVFCERCGASLDRPTPEVVLTPRTTRSRGSLVSFLAVIIVLIGMLAVIAGLVSRQRRGVTAKNAVVETTGEEDNNQGSQDAKATPSGSVPKEEQRPASVGAGGWETAAPMPTARAGHVAVVVGEAIYVIGGVGRDGPTGVNEVYSVSDNRWWTGAGIMPTPRAFAGASVVGNRIYVVGGVYKGAVVGTVESYDPKTNGWAKRHAPLPVPRAACGVAAVNGRLYVIGGVGVDNKPMNDLWCYDVRTDSWTQLRPMSIPRGYPGVAVMGASIYVVGGTSVTGAVSMVEYFDTLSGAWHQVGKMEGPAGGLGMAMVDSTLYLIGSSPGSSSALSGDLFDASAWKRHAIPDLPVPPQAGAAVAACEGRIYVFGGTDGTRYLDTVYCYRPPKGDS